MLRERLIREDSRSGQKRPGPSTHATPSYWLRAHALGSITEADPKGTAAATDSHSESSRRAGRRAWGSCCQDFLALEQVLVATAELSV